MCFLIEHDDLFGNHDTIMDKVSVGIKKKINGESVYSETLFKIKTKSDADEVCNF